MTVLYVSTHDDFGEGLVPDLDHALPRRAVHPGSSSVQHGQWHGGGQLVNPLQHGPLGPAQRLCHGPETHLATGRRRRNGQEGGTSVGTSVGFLQASCSAIREKVFAYLGVCALQW